MPTGLKRFLTIFLLSASIPGTAASIELPSMGEASSAVLSLEQERELGQAWLRSFRARTGLNSDYLLQEYVEDLLAEMAIHSAIEDKRLDVLVVDNPSLNAFAVPGGIIGVNTGLFLHATSEAQFASVLAHELSHLSQRHFARSVAESRSSAVTTMAGLLAGIILAATTGSDAGLAAISATQAAALESSLRYSRLHEQEADRIGIEVLARAGYDPNAMAEMFENMLRSTRYTGYQAPEYLRSHPLTESRVSDAVSRARQFPDKYFPESQTYSLMRARVDARESGSPIQAVQKFESLVEESPLPAHRYALALAYQNALRFSEALSIAQQLFEQNADIQPFGLLYADLLNSQGRSAKAVQIVADYLQSHPHSYALNMSMANFLTHDGQYAAAAKILLDQVRLRPNDAVAWYEYSEVLGLAGDILKLHKSRARYFMLTGAFSRAIRQLQLAKKEAADNQTELAIIGEMISEAARLRSSSQF